MILVVTGTTYAFDDLIRAIDALAPRLQEKVVVQTGMSQCLPKHCEHFAFSDDIQRLIEDASLVISHGGAGFSYSILAAGKRLISVENKNVNDSHQWDLLQKLESEGYVLWCKDLATLDRDVNVARTKSFVEYSPPPCTIHEEIIAFLESERQGATAR
jgi:beta-1,4-N-acetylglucosaminyltransferase